MKMANRRQEAKACVNRPTRFESNTTETAIYK